MDRVASSDQELTVEERRLLYVARRNVVQLGARCESWRIASSIGYDEDSMGSRVHVVTIKGHQEETEIEQAKVYEDVLDGLGTTEHLTLRLQREQGPSNTLRGPLVTRPFDSILIATCRLCDCHRYLADFATGDKQTQDTDASIGAYKAASDVAVSIFGPPAPFLPGLALTLSVLYHGTSTGSTVHATSPSRRLMTPSLG